MSYLNSLNKKYIKNVLKNNILQEGIEELQKYFPKMDLNKIKELVALDPTYKGGNELGKYGKWIIKLAYNNIKNIENQKQFTNLIKQYPNKVNPKTGQKFQEPQLLPSIKDEDLYKITDSLKKYDLYKKEIKKPLDSFKSLPELDSELSQIQNKGVPTNELALKRYNLFKKAEEKGLKKIYEDDKWIVGIPTTKESSCVFGSDTSWCTTSAGGKYYENYTAKGDLFINLNKQTGELFQFHFETEQFMNEHDNSINMDNFSEENPQLVKVYQNFLDKKIALESPEEKTKEILNNKNKLNDYFENLSDIRVDDNYVYGKLDVIYIPNDIYYNYSRNIVSLKFISEVLNWNGFDDWYSDYNINDLNYRIDDIDFNSKMKKYNITWDDVVNLYNNYNIYNDNDYKNFSNETINKIYKLFDDNDTDPLSIYNYAIKSGSIADAHNNILDDLKENLPLDNENPNEDSDLNIKFPIKDIIKSIELQKKEKEDIANEYMWYERYRKLLSYYFDDEYNWLYKWREIHFDEVEFSIYEPQNGWDGFDEYYWEECMNYFMKKLGEILEQDPLFNKNDYDEEINESLKLAGVLK